MGKYHKIDTIYERDMDAQGRIKPIIPGAWTRPEFEALKDMQWEWTEKVDGMCITVEWDGESVRFYGKTEDAQIPARLAHWMQHAFTVEKFLEAEVPFPCTLYGEGCGPKIQKGGSGYGNDQRVILFDAKTVGGFLPREAVDKFASALGIESVPVVGRGTIKEAEWLVSNGFPSTWGDFAAEGLVLRPCVELCNRSGHRIIAKIKTRDYRRGE